MKTKKLFLAVRTSSSYELQPNWRPISRSPAKRTCSCLYPWNVACLPGRWLIRLTVPQSSFG